MANLQLAENDIQLTPQNFYGDVTALAENNPKELYVFIPAGYRGSQEDMYVREDALDNLPEHEFNKIMFDLEPYQETMLSGKAERKARRAERKANKARRKDITMTKRAGRGGGARRAAKQERVATRQAGKSERTAAGGGAGGTFDKILGTVSGIFGGGGGGEAPVAVQGDMQYNTAADRGGKMDDPPPPDEDTFWDKYKVPIGIGAVVLIGGGIALAMRKKK